MAKCKREGESKRMNGAKKVEEKVQKGGANTHMKKNDPPIDRKTPASIFK